MLAATERTIRATGAVSPPTLFALRQDRVIGMVITRPFYKGEDAIMAVLDLATLPMACNADCVVITWEKSDNISALGGPQLPVQGMEMCVATRTEHWYSFTPVLVGVATSGDIVVRWEPATPWDRDADLPPPFKELLTLCWLQEWQLSLEETCAHMEENGFLVSLTAEPT